jgi:hypothetical protein
MDWMVLKMSGININRSGYLVNYRHPQDGLRTYACADRDSLDALILHLTGREASTFPRDSRGLPVMGAFGITIAHPVHIWYSVG